MANINKRNIRNILKEESPSYRIEIEGCGGMKTSELLTIILKSEMKALSLLSSIEGNLNKLASAVPKTLFPITGKARGQVLLAAIELGKRIAGFSEVEKPYINTPTDVAHLIMSEMRYYKKEVFKVLLLDTKNRLIKIETISSGILDASLVHPREVFYPAIQEKASSIILVHNHPSGNIMPSSQDIEITKTIIEAGKIIGIEVIDHII